MSITHNQMHLPQAIARSTLNITNHGSINYSGMNLLTNFTAGPYWFNNSISSNFSFSINTTVQAQYAMRHNGTYQVMPFDYLNGRIRGQALDIGKYEFFDNRQFSKQIPTETISPFNASVSYVDLLGINHTDECEFVVNGTLLNLTNITLAGGPYDWTLNCSNETMPTEYHTGSFTVVPMTLSYDSVRRFVQETFVVGYDNCSQCSLSIDEDELTLDGCSANLTIMDLESHSLSLTCGDHTREYGVTALDGKQMWDDGQVVGRGTAAHILRGSIISTTDFIVHNNELNGSGNLWSYPDTIVDLGKTYSQEIFYFIGSINNDEATIIIN